MQVTGFVINYFYVSKYIKIQKKQRRLAISGKRGGKCALSVGVPCWRVVGPHYFVFQAMEGSRIASESGFGVSRDVSTNQEEHPRSLETQDEGVPARIL